MSRHPQVRDEPLCVFAEAAFPCFSLISVPFPPQVYQGWPKTDKPIGPFSCPSGAAWHCDAPIPARAEAHGSRHGGDARHKDKVLWMKRRLQKPFGRARFLKQGKRGLVPAGRTPADRKRRPRPPPPIRTLLSCSRCKTAKGFHQLCGCAAATRGSRARHASRAAGRRAARPRQHLTPLYLKSNQRPETAGNVNLNRGV